MSSALAWCLAASPLAAGEPAAGALPPDGRIQGVPVTGAPAVTETTGEIMARHDRTAVSSPQQTLDFFIGRMDTSGKKVDPVAESLLQGPATDPASLRISSGGGGPVPPIGVNADGPGSLSLPSLCGTPPDTMGAVGPTQFISFVNCNIVSYNKATGAPDGVLNTTPNNFFTSVRSSSTSDPHIRYDRTSQRWYLFIIDVTFPSNRVLLAVSNSATITGSTLWRFFFFQSANGTHTSCLADFPTPGIDANAIYIGVNQFCGSSLATAVYDGSDVYVVQKSSILGAGPIHVTGFQSPSDLYTPQGVDNPDPTATEGWVLAGSVNFWNKINLIRVANPGSLTPTISATVPITTANQGTPATQPHLGNTGGSVGKIDGSDNRLFAATYRDGSLWTAMTVGVTVPSSTCVGVAGGAANRNAVFWWELRNIATGSTPTIQQSGLLCDISALNPSFYSYGTIAPNGQGHAAMGFTIAGLNTFLGGGVSERLSSDAPGSLPSSTVYAPGIAAYNPSFDSGVSNGFRRWGDYSFTSLDPCNDMTLWTIQEYVPVANQYGTRFAELKAPPPVTPASASPSSIAVGQASVNVVVTGTSASGSGFYDTPATMSSEPCRTRLAGAVSGVTVNSVTLTDATHVTLNLNTTGASTGTKNVTITNPDGQAATGVGILTIACAPAATPATPVVTAPSVAGAGSPNRTASVASHAGSTYAWTIGNGTITAGQGTSQITITAGTFGSPVTLSVVETNSSGCPSAPGTANVTVAPVGSALQYYTVPPCRVIDTRSNSGFPQGYGPPSLPGGHAQKSFVLAGQCGIPANAQAVSVNATVWAPVTRGGMRAFPAGSATPLVSMLNWEAGIQALANAGILQLGTGGGITVQVDGPGTVDLILDVNGYFQ